MSPLHSIIAVYVSAFALVSASINCDSRNACMNQSLNDNIIRVRGYKGANGARTSLIGASYCSASFSCESIERIQIPLNDQDQCFCHGSHACSSTTISGSIRCIGSNSCMSSEITSTGNSVLECDGYSSCAETRIYSMNTIEANGQYALYKAIIDTENSSSDGVNITLSGDHSGYGATIKCRENHECNIYCNGYNSCLMLYLDCIGECIIYSGDCIGQCILPTTNSTELEAISHDEALYFALNNDETCNTASTSVLFDSYNERRNGDDIIITEMNETSICCRGRSSCRNISRIQYQSTAEGNIVCSAYASCYGSSIISNNGTVFCEGSTSCSKSQIYNASSVYCTGSHSCYSKTVITNSHRILCSAYWGCARAKIVSAGSDLNVYLTGSYSGAYSEIYCNATDACNVVCDGYMSCFNVILICDGVCTVQCNNKSDCPLGWKANVISDPTQSPTQITSNPTENTSTAILDPTQSPTQITSNPTENTVFPTEFTTDPSTQYTSLTTSNPSVTNMSNISLMSSISTVDTFTFGIFFYFHFKFEDMNININVTKKAEAVVTDIIYNEILTNFARDEIENCIKDSYGLNVNESMNGTTSICGIIAVCDEDIEYKLLDLYKSSLDSLETRFMNSFEPENEIEEIHIAFESVNISEMKCGATISHGDHDSNTNNDGSVAVIVSLSVFGLCCLCFVLYKWHKRNKTHRNDIKQIKRMVYDEKEINIGAKVEDSAESVKQSVVLAQVQIKTSQKHKMVKRRKESSEELYGPGIEEKTKAGTGETNGDSDGNDVVANNAIREFKPTIEGDPGDKLAHDNQKVGKGEQIVLNVTVEGHMEDANIRANDEATVTNETKGYR